MKLTLTCNVTEAAAQLKSFKGVDEVVITTDTQPTAYVTSFKSTTNFIQAILSVTRLHLCRDTYRSSDKIGDIKRLRGLVDGLGLAQAKYAIENPQIAIEFYLNNNSFPTGY